MENELESLRKEVADLRREVAELRATREVHHYHHAPSLLGPTHSPPSYYPAQSPTIMPQYPGQPWWPSTSCGKAVPSGIGVGLINSLVGEGAC